MSNSNNPPKTSRIPQPIAVGQPLFPVRPGTVLHQLIDYTNEASNQYAARSKFSGFYNMDNESPNNNPSSSRNETPKTPTTSIPLRQSPRQQKTQNSSRPTTPSNNKQLYNSSFIPTSTRTTPTNSMTTTNAAFEKSLRQYQYHQQQQQKQKSWTAPNSRITSPNRPGVNANRPTTMLSYETRAALPRAKGRGKSIGLNVNNRDKVTLTPSPTPTPNPSSPPIQVVFEHRVDKLRRKLRTSSTSSKPPISPRHHVHPSPAQEPEESPPPRPRAVLTPQNQNQRNQLNPIQLTYTPKLNDSLPTTRSSCCSINHETPKSIVQLYRSSSSGQQLRSSSRMLPTHVHIEKQPLTDKNGQLICHCVNEEKACQTLSAELLQWRKHQQLPKKAEAQTISTSPFNNENEPCCANNGNGNGNGSWNRIQMNSSNDEANNSQWKSLEMEMEMQQKIIESLTQRNEDLELQLFESQEKESIEEIQLEKRYSREKFPQAQAQTQTDDGEMNCTNGEEFFTTLNGKKYSRAVLDKLKFPLDSYLLSRFSYIINENGDAQSQSQQSGTDSRQYLKNIMAALAAREGLLNELSAKIKRGYKVLQKRYDHLSSLIGRVNDGDSNTKKTLESQQGQIQPPDADYLINSYRRFVRLIHTYLDQSIDDIRKFDEINIFSKTPDSQYFYETTVVIDGDSKFGIFIPLPSYDDDDDANKENENSNNNGNVTTTNISGEASLLRIRRSKSIDTVLVNSQSPNDIAIGFRIEDPVVTTLKCQDVDVGVDIDRSSEKEISTLHFHNWESTEERSSETGNFLLYDTNSDDKKSFPFQKPLEIQNQIFEIYTVHNDVIDNGTSTIVTSNTATATNDDVDEDDDEDGGSSGDSSGGESPTPLLDMFPLIEDKDSNCKSMEENPTTTIGESLPQSSNIPVIPVENIVQDSGNKKTHPNNRESIKKLSPTSNDNGLSADDGDDHKKPSGGNVVGESSTSEEIATSVPPSQRPSPLVALMNWVDRHPSPITTTNILDPISITRFFDPTYEPSPQDMDNNQVDNLLNLNTGESGIERGCDINTSVQIVDEETTVENEENVAESEVSLLVDGMIMDYRDNNVVTLEYDQSFQIQVDLDDNGV